MKTTHKLSIKEVAPNFSFAMNKDCAISRIKYLADSNIDFDVYLKTKGCNLQRPFVWTLLQKQQLILAIFKENPIPKMCVIEHDPDGTEKNKVYQIIDGKQRLNAMLSFYRGEFPIEVNGEEFYYDDLDGNLQMRIRTYQPKADIGYSYHDDEISDDVKIAWFDLVNFAGTQQDLDHMKMIKSLGKKD